MDDVTVGVVLWDMAVGVVRCDGGAMRCDVGVVLWEAAVGVVRSVADVGVVLRAGPDEAGLWAVRTGVGVVRETGWRRGLCRTGGGPRFTADRWKK